MKKHKFKIGNPCGPCEYHIEKAVKIFAWFDLIFQSIFVVPVILQFKIYLCKFDTTRDGCEQHRMQENHQADHVEGDSECYEDRMDIAVAYSMLDIFNLSLGILTDVLLYISCAQRRLGLKFFGAWLFFVLSFLRQIFHCSAAGLHVIRCSPGTYPYEIVTRLLCQYLLYGMWIVMEYIFWLHKGRNFVPSYRNMEPPDEQVAIEEKFTYASFGSISNTRMRYGSELTVSQIELADIERIRRKMRKAREKGATASTMQQTQSIEANLNSSSQLETV